MSSSSEFSNLLAYKIIKDSFIILLICKVNINVSSLIPNFSNVSLLSFFLVSLAKSLSILLMFSKNQLLVLLVFSFF